MNRPVLDPQSFLCSAIPPTLYLLLVWAELEEETPLKGLGEAQRIREGDREGMHPICRDQFAQLCPSKLYSFLTVHNNCTLLSPLTLHWKHQLLFIHFSSHMSFCKPYMVEDIAFLVPRRNTYDYEKIRY